MEWYLLVLSLAALLAVYFFITLFYKPLRLLARLVMYLVIGVVLISVLNFVLGFINMHISLNLFTALIAGVLQLPGLIMLLIINYWFV